MGCTIMGRNGRNPTRSLREGCRHWGNLAAEAVPKLLEVACQVQTCTKRCKACLKEPKRTLGNDLA